MEDTSCKLVKKTHWRRQYRANDWLQEREDRESKKKRKEERKVEKERKRLEREIARKRDQYYRKNELRVSLGDALKSAVSELI